MVFEHTFVQLVENVGCDTAKYITVWKCSPERFIDGTKTLFFEQGRVVSVSMKIQRLERVANISKKAF